MGHEGPWQVVRALSTDGIRRGGKGAAAEADGVIGGGLTVDNDAQILCQVGVLDNK